MRLVLLALLTLALAVPAQAQTCFKTCLVPRLTAASIGDDQIRAQMKQCRDQCEAATALPAAAITCEPQQLPDAAMKQIRSASSSPVLVAGALTWDVSNPFKGQIIRRVELTVQNMELQDISVSAPGTVLPGQTATILVILPSDGYPATALATRIGAIYACPAE